MPGRAVKPNPIELYSPLSLTECAQRLESAIDCERSVLISFSSMFGTKPVVGRVTQTSLKLRKRIGYRNSFQSFLTAAMRAEGTGTVISGEFAMHPFVRVFMILWFSGVILIGGTMFFITIGALLFGPTHHGDHAWIGAVVPPIMIGFGVGLIRFGQYLARNEARFITDFLLQTLNAKDRNS